MVLYLDCGMGAAGDMLLAALLELMPDLYEAMNELNALGIPGVRYSMLPAEKCGIHGTRVSVTVRGVEEGEGLPLPEHGGVSDISNIIMNLNLSETVKKSVLEVYRLVAEAEARVHAAPVEQVHFHELGALDAVADIAGVCLLMERLSPSRVVASPVTTGFGAVKCAHGIIPVPAPATAEILKGVPVRGGNIEGELCTPTGAALLRHFVSEFSEMPLMRVQKIGYGCGKKDFPRANCVRALLGEDTGRGGEVAQLSCNLDDMTGEDIAFATERLLELGALDVWTQPVYMKKNRPGVVLCCLCRADEAEKFAGLILTHTTSIGVRETLCRRYTLPREIEKRHTPLGEVRFKVSTLPDGSRREKPEFDDISRLAGDFPPNL